MLKVFYFFYLNVITINSVLSGAFRMRGIAKGQTIELFIIPEVRNMVTQHVGPNARFGTISDQQLLAGVSAWLVVNAMKSETTQSNIQNIIIAITMINTPKFHLFFDSDYACCTNSAS